MSIVDKKKEVFGKIGAFRTLTGGLPNLKPTSSFSSVNNNGNVVTFLTDLVKSLVGYEILVSSIVDTLIYSTPKIENSIKQALKLELKTIVSCGVDPHLPSWFKSDGTGIIIEVKQLDFLDILRTDPNSVGGKLLYDDVTPQPLNSSDFNTFLYGVIQDDGVTHTWKNIFDITFNSLGNNTRPNNTITIKSNSSYDTKTLTDLNNNYVDGIKLLNTENVVNKTMDVIYGSVSSFVGKSLKQLEQEAQINDIIDKMVNNTDINSLDDSYFVFSKEETYEHQLQAANRKKGSTPINVSTPLTSSVPVTDLTTFNDEMVTATNVIQKKDILTNNLNTMANSSADKVRNPTDVSTVKLNFIQQIINALTKSIISIFLSPKIIFSFILNYKIVYGPDATFSGPIDFIKKNKNLMNIIMKKISEQLIKILLVLALKEIALLVASAVAKRQKEKATNQLAQLSSLVGIQQDKIKEIINNLA